MTAKKKLEARIISKTDEYKGFLTISKLQIERDNHDGSRQTVTWLMMERGHAVAVLAYDPVEDLVILGNEMRPGILVAGGYPYTDNLLAGGINKDETPIEAAVRETMEEAGLELQDPLMIHDKSYVSSGGTSERISIVFGIVASKKAGGIHGAENESESIKTTILTSDEFMARIRSNDINDLKTMVAGYWLIENRDRLRQQYGVKATCVQPKPMKP